MATITTILSGDNITNSRAVINNNFSALNTDKIETSVLDTDTTLAANSDAKVATQKATKAYVDALGGQTFLVPTGAILPYGATTAPANFLLCNGQAVSRSTYATLLAVIGTTYGVGDGSTTFNLPDLQSRFPLGYSASAPTKVFTFASRASNVITITGADNHAQNELQTGQAVVYTTSGTVITGLTSGSTYYLIRSTYNSFSLATSIANANAGTVIALSSDGTGTQLFTATYTVRPLGQKGGEETHALTDNELPSHTHSYYTNSVGAIEVMATDGSGSSGNPLAGLPTGNDIPHSIMPLFTVVNYIIKT